MPTQRPLVIVGLTGKARSGKDSAANALIQQGYIKMAFADPLKRALAALTGEVLNAYHSDELKEAVTPALGITRRKGLQDLGTAIRTTFGSEAFVRLLQYDILRGNPGHRYYVVSDVRYPNEAQALREMGGIIIQVSRPDHAGLTGLEALHSSEAGLPPEMIDGTVVNDGSLEDLYRKVTQLTVYWETKRCGIQ